MAAPKGVLNLLVLILENGAEANHTNKHGATALHKAAVNNQSAACKKLLTVGATVNQQDAGGNTALHYAAKIGAASCIKVLLGSGADGELENNNTEKPEECCPDPKTKEEFEKYRKGAFKRGAQAALAQATMGALVKGATKKAA